MPLRFSYAGVAQSVAHLIGSEEVTGPIPVASFRVSNEKQQRKGALYPRRIYSPQDTGLLFFSRGDCRD